MKREHGALDLRKRCQRASRGCPRNCTRRADAHHTPLVSLNDREGRAKRPDSRARRPAVTASPTFERGVSRVRPTVWVTPSCVAMRRVRRPVTIFRFQMSKTRRRAGPSSPRSPSFWAAVSVLAPSRRCFHLLPTSANGVCPCLSVLSPVVRGHYAFHL